MGTFESAVRENWPDVADLVLGLVRGTVDPFTVPAAESWRRQCYHQPDPRKPETIMYAIGSVLAGYGSEAVWGESETRPVMEYVNMGDTYDTTIAYDYAAGRYRVTSWGDWVEKYGDRLGVR
jgi:hypothetical protein